jgi:hypothetical protein
MAVGSQVIALEYPGRNHGSLAFGSASCRWWAGYRVRASIPLILPTRRLVDPIIMMPVMIESSQAPSGK